MDDTNIYPPIVDEIGWLRCGDPKFLEEKQSLVLGRLHQVRRELAKQLGTRRINRLEGQATAANTHRIWTLRYELQQLEELLIPTSWMAQANYLVTAIRRLPEEYQVYVGQQLRAEEDIEEPLLKSNNSRRIQFRISCDEFRALLHARGEQTASSYVRQLLSEVDFDSAEPMEWPLPKGRAKLTEKIWCRIPINLARSMNSYCRKHQVQTSRVARSVLAQALKRSERKNALE